MPRAIVKLAENTYVEWSTVVDAPVTYTSTKEEMLIYLDEEYGRSKYEDNRQRLERADQTGTSFRFGDVSVDRLIETNRAGPKGVNITLEEILEQYHPSKAT